MAVPHAPDLIEGRVGEVDLPNFFGRAVKAQLLPSEFAMRKSRQCQVTLDRLSVRKTLPVLWCY